MKAELQTELNITISESTINRRIQEAVLYGRAARKKPYVNKVNRSKRRNMLELIVKNLSGSGVMFFDRTKVNSTCLDQMQMLWYGDQRKKN